MAQKKKILTIITVYEDGTISTSKPTTSGIKTNDDPVGGTGDGGGNNPPPPHDP